MKNRIPIDFPRACSSRRQDFHGPKEACYASNLSPRGTQRRVLTDKGAFLSGAPAIRPSGSDKRWARRGGSPRRRQWPGQVSHFRGEREGEEIEDRGGEKKRQIRGGLLFLGALSLLPPFFFILGREMESEISRAVFLNDAERRRRPFFFPPLPNG